MLEIYDIPSENKKKNIVELYIFLLEGCSVCIFLLEILYDIIIKSKNINFQIKEIRIKKIRDILGYGICIRVAPTIIAFKHGRPRLGWEGFAALAPDAVKREMVEDVLRQVAELTNEDDRIDDLLH